MKTQKKASTIELIFTAVTIHMEKASFSPGNDWNLEFCFAHQWSIHHMFSSRSCRNSSVFMYSCCLSSGPKLGSQSSYEATQSSLCLQFQKTQDILVAFSHPWTLMWVLSFSPSLSLGSPACTHTYTHTLSHTHLIFSNECWKIISMSKTFYLFLWA